jgi:hypothetical protein
MEKEPNPSEELLIERFEKLLMCSVSQRYALLYSWGVDHRAIKLLSMENAPDLLADNLSTYLGNWYRGDEDFNLEQKILETPLPEGIPDVLDLDRE